MKYDIIPLMFMNFWKKLPYWLKGGIIGGGIALIFVVLFYSCAFSFSFIPTSNDYAGLICFVFFMFGPIQVASWLIGFFEPVFHYDWFFNQVYSPLISVFVWFIFGSLIGALVGYIKSKKWFTVLAILACVLLVIFSSYLLVIKTRPSIISISPSSAKIGDTINVTVFGIDHEGYSYVDLVKGEHDKGYDRYGQLWVGKVPDSNIISFTITTKALPGDYKLGIYGSNPYNKNDGIFLESNFKIIP